MEEQPGQTLSKRYIRARLVKPPIFMVIGFLIFTIFNRFEALAPIGLALFRINGVILVVGILMYLIAALLRRG
jgi:hypothetical protein